MANTFIFGQVSLEFVDRPIRIVVPFKYQGSKSRLCPILSPKERRLLALSMLADVLMAVSGLGRVTIISRPGFWADRDGEAPLDIPVPEVRESELPLNDALNHLIEEQGRSGWPEDLLIVMADLALISEEDVRTITRVSGDVVLSPGRGGGTNMMLIRDPRFRTCYQGLSFPKHRDLARSLGLHIGYYYSYLVGCDIDEPEDLAEIMIHGHGLSLEVVTAMGFELSEKSKPGHSLKKLSGHRP
ncbi:MAG: 2-phospho-L-lactate guanylyltransferase [Methanosarcinales archaeon]|nr:2-phospho-L-lactate guanylyltransferase [Methanosarcinales archaeon]